MKRIKKWLSQFFCDHDYIYKSDARGIITHAEVICTKCGKTKIVTIKR